LALALLMVAILAPAGADAAESKRILLIHSYGRDFSPWNDYARAMRPELDRQIEATLDVYEVTLASARYADEPVEDSFADYLRALFANRPLDLVITIGGPAANFFQKNRQRISPGAPLLLTAVEERRVALGGVGPNDVSVAVRVDLAGSIENIIKVLPSVTNIAVVVGASPNEKYWAGQLRDAVKVYADRLTFTWFSDLSFEDMLKRAAALPPRSAIYYGLLSVDAAGVVHEGGQALDRLRAAANAPIFSYVDAYFGRGIVGGPQISVEDVSRQSAIAAARILRGEPLGEIKSETIGFAMPRYDWRELRRWGIAEKVLPAGSIVEFRQPSLFELYRWQLTAIAGAILLQSLMISGLLVERGRRRTAEAQLRNRLLQVVHLNRIATAGALSTSIAHELNQPLGAILNNAEAAEILLEADNPDIGQIKEIVGDIRRDDQRAADIIRHLRGLLQRGAVDTSEFDLNAEVANAISILEPEAAKRGVELRHVQNSSALPVRADPVHVQQVILNLAINGMDAMQGVSGARVMSIEAATNGHATAEVSVSDNGAGIPADKLGNIFETFYTTKSHGTGLGLSIARTIVETYGGRIWAENRTAGGASVRFTLPLTRGQGG
jgi:signal transduction histidine kinase